MAKAQHSFAGSIPENYDRYLGPILFEPYAQDMAKRLPVTGLGDVLELAAGTGILTRHLRERLGENTRVVATDLSEGMLNVAKAKPGYNKPVEWKAVDATSLPYKDGSFDAVVCQFGIMFFPDKAKAVQEVLRVLRPGGRFLFSVWDKIEFNDFANIASDTVIPMFETDPPKFYEIPYGYHDHFEIRKLLRDAGFIDVAMHTIELKAEAKARDAAAGYIEGNPIATEITDRLGQNLSDVTDKVEKAIADALGQKMAKGRLRAIVVGGRKPGTFQAVVSVPVSETAAPKAATRPAPKRIPAKKPAAQPKPKAGKATPKPKPAGPKKPPTVPQEPAPNPSPS